MRDQTSNDDHEWYDPPCDLSEIDLVNPALKPDFEIDGENWLLDWRLHHFLDPFHRKLKGDKNEKATDRPITKAIANRCQVTSGVDLSRPQALRMSKQGMTVLHPGSLNARRAYHTRATAFDFGLRISGTCGCVEKRQDRHSSIRPE